VLCNEFVKYYTDSRGGKENSKGHGGGWGYPRKT
jgi:hypothetical protein